RFSDARAYMCWRYSVPARERLYDRAVVLAPFSRLYLDYPTHIERVYAFDPAPADLTAEQAAHVLGAEAAMWTGYPNARTEAGVEKGIFPRVLALAELSWTPQELREFSDF